MKKKEYPKMFLYCMECKRDYENKSEKEKIELLEKTIYPSGNANEKYTLVRFMCPKGHNSKSIMRNAKGDYYNLLDDKWTLCEARGLKQVPVDKPKPKAKKVKETPGIKEKKVKETPGIKEKKTTETPGIKEKKTTETPGIKEKKVKETPGIKEKKVKETPGIKEKKATGMSDTFQKTLM